MRRIVGFAAFVVLSAHVFAADPPTLYERVARRLEHDPAFAARLEHTAPEMQEVDGFVGRWTVTAHVFATATTPERTDTGTSTVTRVAGGAWLAISGEFPSGTQDYGLLGYDGVNRRWVTVALDSSGNALTLTANAWDGDRLVFGGLPVRIVGEPVTLRQTLERRGADTWRVFNEERLPNGRWVALDEYLYRRRTD